MRPVETVARFGPGKSLSGIFTVPAKPASVGAPAIVIPNTGIGHRSSHHRLFVIFARALAGAGYPVLRFDLSGLGDSLSRGAGVERGEADRADLRAAIDWVEAAGHREVILLGLCSGADRSVVYASEDRRIGGLILLDPTVPPTLRFIASLLSERLAQGARKGFLPFLRRLGRRVSPKRSNNAPSRGTRRGTGPAAWIAWYKIPAFLEGAYSRSVAQGHELLVVFTSGVQRRHSYRERLTEAFPRIDFGDRLTVTHLDGIHHLFVLEDERRRVMAAMLDWLALRRPLAPADVSSADAAPAF